MCERQQLWAPLNSSGAPLASGPDSFYSFLSPRTHACSGNGANLQTVLRRVGRKEECDQRDSYCPAGKPLPSTEWPGSIVLIKMSVFGWKYWNTVDGSLTPRTIILEQNHCVIVPFYFFSPFFFFFSLVGKLLEPFKKMIIYDENLEKQLCLFSEFTPVAWTTKCPSATPPWKALGKYSVTLATHLENPSFRLKHILKLNLRDVPNHLSSF